MSGVQLVTGGSGYLGTELVRALVSRHDPVRVLDLHPPDDAAHVDLVLGDVRDVSVVHRAMRGVEVVHHAVAQVPLARDPALFRSVNRDGTARVLEAAARAGVRKVVVVSSSAVYGIPRRNPVTEDTIPEPAEAYGREKLAAEWICREWAARGLDVTIVRPRTIVGPGRLGLFQILFEWVREGRNLPVFGGGANVYQFVHPEDLVSACLLAASRPGPAVYNVGAERFGTMRETLEALVRHAGTGSRVVSVPRLPAELGMWLGSRTGLAPLADYHRLLYGHSLWFDVSRAKAELAWASRWSNERLVCDAWDWYAAHRDEVLARKDASPHRSALKQGLLALGSRWL